MDISNNAMVNLMASFKYDRHIIHSLMNQPYNCEEIHYASNTKFNLAKINSTAP